MHRATLTALLGILLGVAFCEKYLFSTEVACMFFGVGVVSGILLLLKRKHERKNLLGDMHASLVEKCNLALFVTVFSLSFVVGVVRMQFIEEKEILVCESACTFMARVVTSPEIKDVYQIFAVASDENSNLSYVQVKTPLYPQVHIGERVSLSGKVAVPKSSMPHGEARSFDYGAYLALHAIGSEMYYPHIEVLAEDSDTSFFTRLVRLKESCVNLIGRYIDTPSSTLASGMLFGDSSMSRELTQTFRTAGLSHIVVLSGFNIAILISFVLFVCMFLPLVLRVIVSTLLVIFFVMMVGAEVSVIRATLMSLIALVALLLGRAYTARQALLLSLLLIVMYKPSHVRSDVSLHLSFLATAGIIYLSDGLSQLFVHVRKEMYREMLVTTCAAYLATLPYIMYTFGTVSLYALVANMMVLPLVPVMMLITFLVVVSAATVPFLGMVFGYTCTVLGEIIIFVARTVESLPYASLTVSISFFTMIVMYICGGFIFYVTTTRVTDKKNETLLTKNDEILSDVITY